MSVEYSSTWGFRGCKWPTEQSIDLPVNHRVLITSRGIWNWQIYCYINQRYNLKNWGNHGTNEWVRTFGMGNWCGRKDGHGVRSSEFKKWQHGMLKCVVSKCSKKNSGKLRWGKLVVICSLFQSSGKAINCRYHI